MQSLLRVHGPLVTRVVVPMKLPTKVNRRRGLLIPASAMLLVFVVAASVSAQQTRRMGSIESLIVDVSPIAEFGAIQNTPESISVGEPVIALGGQVHQGGDPMMIDEGDLGADVASETNSGLTLASLESIALAGNPSIQRTSALVAAARARAL